MSRKRCRDRFDPIGCNGGQILPGQKPTQCLNGRGNFGTNLTFVKCLGAAARYRAERPTECGSGKTAANFWCVVVGQPMLGTAFVPPQVLDIAFPILGDAGKDRKSVARIGNSVRKEFFQRPCPEALVERLPGFDSAGRRYR